MASHSSILARGTPWTEMPDSRYFMGVTKSGTQLRTETRMLLQIRTQALWNQTTLGS